MSKTDLPSLPETTAGASEERAPAFPLATGSPSVKRTRIHMCQSVRGPLMNWTKRDWKNATKWIKPADGGRCTADELKAHFLKLLTEGHEVIPIGDCDDFDPKTGCRGHPYLENKERLTCASVASHQV